MESQWACILSSALNVLIVAEHLSVRLLILQSVFSIVRVCTQLLSHLRLHLKVWLACKHPSHLGMQLKDPVYKSCVHLHKFITPMLYSTSSLIVTMSKWQKKM